MEIKNANNHVEQPLTLLVLCVYVKETLFHNDYQQNPHCSQLHGRHCY